MKVLHISLNSTYDEGWLYQENLLPKQNALDGNEVVIVCSTSKYFSSDSQVAEYINKDSIKVCRINSLKCIPKILSAKLRFFPKLRDILDREKPDIIFHHGIQGLTLLTAARYKKRYLNVKLFCDNHADYMNSAKNFVSKWIFNKLFYKSIIKISLKYIDKIYYVTVSRKRFVTEMYNISESKLEFLPLGGQKFSEAEYDKNRAFYREQFKCKDSDVVFLHTGKFDRAKKTLEMIKMFEDLNLNNAKLILCGKFEDGLKMPKAGANIVDMGWTDPIKLREIMCACDVLLQPGSHSVLFEQGIICNLATILKNNEHNTFLTKYSNGVLVNNLEETKNAVRKLASNKDELLSMRESAKKFANDYLLYSNITKEIFKI